MATLSSPRQPTTRESATALGVLAVLVTVCAWLSVVQRRFSPAVMVAAAAAQSAQTAGAMSDGSAGAAGAQQAAPARMSVPDLLAGWPAGLRPLSSAERFTAETLSDKIDGKAELYLSAGVVGMRCQRVAVDVTDESPAESPTRASWFEAFVYDMGTPENAFAVYSSQKRATTQEAGIGDYGYIAGNQVCAVHGRYYLEVVGADDSAHIRAGALALARAFITTTPVARHANMARDESLFPTEGLQPGSIMLMSADVFGFDQLTNTYIARYSEGGNSFTLFLARRANAAEATQLAAAVRRFFVDDCGGRELAAPNAPAGACLVDEGGTFDAVFASGSFVAGVHQAPDRAVAEQALRRLNDQVNRATP